MSKSNFPVVCLLDGDLSALQARTRLLSSAGWRVEPFTDPDPFLEYARIHHPEAAIVRFGGSHANGLEIKARLREVSPVTSVFISLRVHAGQAHRMLSEDALVNLVEQQCIGTASRLNLKGRSSFANQEVEVECST